MLTLEHVSKHYGKKAALTDLNLTFSQGLNFVLGPSGSGKSTLLKIISGLTGAYEGRVLLAGQDIRLLVGSKENRYLYQKVGIVWQEDQLFSYLSVKENILLALELSDQDEIQEILQVKAVLAELGIAELLEKKVRFLSGGQKQRVAIARALINQPEILIADEPTSALDPEGKAQLLALFARLAEERTVIIVTHEKKALLPAGNRFYLKGGQLVKQETTTGDNGRSYHGQYRRGYTLLDALKGNWRFFKGRLAGYLALMLLAIGGTYLLTLGISNQMTAKNDSRLDELTARYGGALYNIDIVSEMIAAGRTQAEDEAPETGSVKQDISQVFARYQADPRLEGLYSVASFFDYELTIPGVTTDYPVTASNNMPVNNGLVAGKMFDNGKDELVVPESLLETLGLKAGELLGQTITLQATGYDSQTQPHPITITGKVTGVIDTTMRFDDGSGEMTTVNGDDQFIFSRKLVKQVYEDLGRDPDSAPVELRTKKLADIAAIVDELQKDGLVPIGQFQLAGDLSQFNESTRSQTSDSRTLLLTAGLILLMAAGLLLLFLKYREWMILKVVGYGFKEAGLAAAVMGLLLFIGLTVGCGLLLPLAAVGAKEFLDLNMLAAGELATAFLTLAIFCLVAAALSGGLFAWADPQKVLKRGE